MTRKDYNHAVEIIRSNYKVYDSVNYNIHNQMFLDVLIDSFVEFFSVDNPRFDEDKFRSACRGK